MWQYTRFRSARTIERNGARISGFFAGAFGTMLAGMFFVALYSGEPAFTAPVADPTPVYPNF